MGYTDLKKEPERFSLKEELLKLGYRKCVIDPTIVSCMQET